MKRPQRTKSISSVRLLERGMQGLITDIVDLETCWLRGQAPNRWLFAALGVVMQMHQYRAWQEGRSTWAIKQEVLGQ